MARRPYNRGFTLMEILVALTVFAFIGILCARLMQGTLGNQEVVRERSERLVEVQRAMLMLKRDLMQIVDRPVRDILGDSRGPVLIGSDGLMEFSRLGWRNPLGHPRADVQRVTYVVEDGDLYRALVGRSGPCPGLGTQAPAAAFRRRPDRVLRRGCIGPGTYLLAVAG